MARRCNRDSAVGSGGRAEEAGKAREQLCRARAEAAASESLLLCARRRARSRLRRMAGGRSVTRRVSRAATTATTPETFFLANNSKRRATDDRNARADETTKGVKGRSALVPLRQHLLSSGARWLSPLVFARHPLIDSASSGALRTWLPPSMLSPIEEEEREESDTQSLSSPRPLPLLARTSSSSGWPSFMSALRANANSMVEQLCGPSAFFLPRLRLSDALARGIASGSTQGRLSLVQCNLTELDAPPKGLLPHPATQTLLLSRNVLRDLCGAPRPLFRGLQSLSLSYNCLVDPQLPAALGSLCPALRSLSIEGNPLCELLPELRAHLLASLPLLRQLDGAEVGADERRAAVETARSRLDLHSSISRPSLRHPPPGAPGRRLLRRPTGSLPRPARAGSRGAATRSAGRAASAPVPRCSGRARGPSAAAAHSPRRRHAAAALAPRRVSAVRRGRRGLSRAFFPRTPVAAQPSLALIARAALRGAPPAPGGRAAAAAGAGGEPGARAACGRRRCRGSR